MAPLRFQSWYDNFAPQALHIILPSETSGHDHTDQKARMPPALTIGHKKGSDVVFNQNLYLPLEAILPSSFLACCAQDAQDIASYFTNSTTIDRIPTIPHIPTECVPIITRPQTWYCCSCPASYSFNTSRCVECHHDRCQNCRTD